MWAFGLIEALGKFSFANLIIIRHEVLFSSVNL